MYSVTLFLFCHILDVVSIPLPIILYISIYVGSEMLLCDRASADCRWWTHWYVQLCRSDGGPIGMYNYVGQMVDPLVCTIMLVRWCLEKIPCC